MCYPAGATIALFKNGILNIFNKHKFVSAFCLIFLLVITYKLRFNDIIMNMSSITLVLLIVWFLNFLVIRSNIFYFFGKHAFSMFILQRIPGILISTFFSNYGIDKYILISFDFAATIAIALIYDRFLKRLDTALTNKLRW
jgi:hypothetical protein